MKYHIDQVPGHEGLHVVASQGETPSHARGMILLIEAHGQVSDH